MTRSISTSMASVLERMELERPAVVTSEILNRILQEEGILTPARIVAARLREKGWLLPTAVRGAWEFIPASSAGAYSSNDPLLDIKSMISKHDIIKIGITFQSAAWAHGVADRIPLRIEVATGDAQTSRLLHNITSTSVFMPILEYRELKGVPVLAPESVIVHMAAKPTAVRSWQSTLEWLPELTALLERDAVIKEISNRSKAVIARTGYLLQGMRPDVADYIHKRYTPTCKTWFGSRMSLLRHDNKWLIADTMLPFDPRKLRSAI